MTFVELVAWAGTAAALGVISSYALQLIRNLAPSVDEDTAMFASVLFAALASIAAKLAEPYIGSLPPEVAAFWPTFVWLAQQVWYYIVRDKLERYRKLRSYGIA